MQEYKREKEYDALKMNLLTSLLQSKVWLEQT